MTITATEEKVLKKMEPGQWYSQHRLETGRVLLTRLVRRKYLKRQLFDGFGLKYPEGNCTYCLTRKGVRQLNMLDVDKFKKIATKADQKDIKTQLEAVKDALEIIYSKGYTHEQVKQWLAECGLTINRDTLAKYVRNMGITANRATPPRSQNKKKPSKVEIVGKDGKDVTYKDPFPQVENC